MAPAVAPWPHCTSSAKISKFRLVVGLGLLGQEQRPRHHLGVGLLRARPHDDAALEHAVRLVVEHRLEHFAALAAARDVVGNQRRVGVLAALEQRRAAECWPPFPRRRI